MPLRGRAQAHRAASSAREPTPSFWKIAATWFLTVLGDVPRVCAISALPWPPSIRRHEDRWASSRPIWNRHAYSVTHVTDDGRVVRTRDWRQNWLVPGLNNFRQNVQGDLGLLNIADLTVVFHDLSELCEAELPAELAPRARVCNRGTNPVGDGVLVHFAEGARLVCEARTTRLLLPGDCEEVSCTGTVTSAEDLIVRVDPDDEIADCRPGNDEGVPAAQLCIF